MLSYKLFTTPTCVYCPKVKEFMKTVTLIGESIDASTPEGFELAKKFEVSSVPTVLFFEDDKLVGTTHKVDEIKKFLSI
ncbi:thioredoxin family protein [Candidatus Woesearchaeota archaeon]|nr:thioredoxin family protein [Candidatus Woesearchaeota archaeon]